MVSKSTYSRGHNTFEKTPLTDPSEHDIVVLYTGLLRVSPKEKTTRLLLSTLVNLLTTNRQTLLPTAVLARLPALLNSLKSRHLTDEDALEDLKTLTELLEEYTKTQTTFDEYAAELNSGHLRWSPPHRNPTFCATMLAAYWMRTRASYRGSLQRSSQRTGRTTSRCLPSAATMLHVL